MEKRKGGVYLDIERPEDEYRECKIYELEKGVYIKYYEKESKKLISFGVVLKIDEKNKRVLLYKNGKKGRRYYWTIKTEDYI